MVRRVLGIRRWSTSHPVKGDLSRMKIQCKDYVVCEVEIKEKEGEVSINSMT